MPQPAAVVPCTEVAYLMSVALIARAWGRQSAERLSWLNASFRNEPDESAQMHCDRCERRVSALFALQEFRICKECLEQFITSHTVS